MEQYPRNQREFEVQFSTEQACREYLFRLRWPEGFRCPSCDFDRFWPVRSVWMQCQRCGRQTSVTAGTIFQDTRKPLVDWFRAMYWLASNKNGASALGLQAVLGLGSYKTAWTWLHKLRRAMVRPGRDRLSGRVEFCALELSVRRRQTESLIVIAAEEDGMGIGRIRISQIQDASSDSLMDFIQDSVEPGSTVHTDGWLGYSGLGKKGYVREITVVKGKNESATELMPRIHLIASLLVRWILATHRGQVSHEHLDFYLDEFTFRFNLRRSKNAGELFYTMVQQAAVTDPVPYKVMVLCSSNGGNRDQSLYGLPE